MALWVVGGSILAYHIYVGVLLDRAHSLSDGAKLFQIALLVTFPLLGAVLVHGFLFGRRIPSPKANQSTENGQPDEPR